MKTQHARGRAASLSAGALLGLLALIHFVYGAGVKPLASFDAQVKPLVARMTLDEKVGQMTQPDQEYIKDLADVGNFFVGSVLSGGNSDPKEGNSLQAWTDMYDRVQ